MGRGGGGGSFNRQTGDNTVGETDTEIDAATDVVLDVVLDAVVAAGGWDGWLVAAVV